MAHGFSGSQTAYYSYDTCLSAPDCKTMPFDDACPFDSADTGWATAQECPESWSDVCDCLYQGNFLPPELYTQFPEDEPGKYSMFPNIAIYGTACAAWDQVPGTPWSHQCAPGSNWPSPNFNWCQLPWCFVDKRCASRIPSVVFNGSMAYYSYDTCGNAPDCYNNFESEPRCPYDPSGSGTFMVHKGSCECLFQGLELPVSVYMSYPLEQPGRYANLTYIRIVGTTCAAWDQVPGTPWAQYCPPTADWCHSNYNFCQLPWCFVGDSCESKLMAHEFSGSQAAYYSYDTCLSTPDCKTMPFDDACPFDSADTGWATAQECPESWSDVCDCLYQGNFLPPELYTQFPEDEPGKYSMFSNIAIYGTACAIYGTACTAWDQVPGTPWSHQCAPGSNWPSPNFNWCQLPWCFVDKRCVSRIPSVVFNGSMAYYSYDACGNAPDCYNNFEGEPRCPYDPSGSGTFMVHKGSCECLFQGLELPVSVYMSYPLEQPGRYANLTYIRIVGTTCAAWDQVPGTPWAQYCPPTADWCHSNYNFCQLPWCFVGDSCESKLMAHEFSGSQAAYYSYDTCLSTPDCKTMPFDDACPFDSADTGWATAQECPESWSDVCDCLYQGNFLPPELYTQFPEDEPGKYSMVPNIAIYGTACAAWDQVPGTPWSHQCAPGSNWSSPNFNWCQLPWCFVDKRCASRIPSVVFNGSMAYYSYDTCGNTPDCYNDFSSDKRCPYDPYGTKSYKVHKGHNCECIYQGRELPSSWFNWNDTDVSDTFGENFIGVYGTTCAAWAQMPGMPDAHLCPAHADWCNSHNNWCQLPWCYVDQSCETKVTSRMIEGSLAPAYYSYDTCLSTPDCKTMPFDDACPFDSADTGWATAQECPESWSDVCDCLYQGNFLPPELYTQFPEDEPGKYSMVPNIAIYGTACAAWDQVPGTPWSHQCAPGSNWSSPNFNWCQLPWCFVDKRCASRIPSVVFNGSMAYYSYDTCGNTPDCYNDFSSDKRCPYDPYGTKSYKVHKGHNCECILHGSHLPADVYTLYPLGEPGKYANLTHISVYGTTCAAWDQMPSTPWAPYCPRDADWCRSEFNFCQLPFCYVTEACDSRVPSSLFQGSSTAAYYSYDTCLSTPDCKTMPFDDACPFDSADTGWATAQECPESWSDVCDCLYQGNFLPPELYTQFPEDEPGKYSMVPNIAIYGTACAAWDQVPGTPWSHQCAPGSNWSSPNFNWCQLPWCFVDKRCASRIPSVVFNGSMAYYSYDTCGNTPDCYNDFSSDKRCPYDPYGTKSYKVHKGHNCECILHGSHLPADVYTLYPLGEPGKYANLTHISVYGTTCAAWDQMPSTPWAPYCPRDADWCRSEFNFCQLPFCYVTEACDSRVPSSLFQGSSTAAYYSYDTCLSTPDCKTMPFDDACPFDSADTGWATAQECPESWSDVCDCLYQGNFLPPELYTQFPEDEPGKYSMVPNIAIYGTACAAWDQVPGTPWSHQCAPGSNWSSPNFNWCQLPWCFVDKRCASRIPSVVFNGSMAYYSYDTCGNTPDCYNDFSSDKRCPYDPYGTKSYKVHKGHNCECILHGSHLPADVYTLYPLGEPGKYANLTHISVYGTTCAAWDQMPSTPWAPYCPRDADWCRSEFNFCQLPFCYVSAECPRKIPTRIWHGVASGPAVNSSMAWMASHFSYDTCLSTPDCYSRPFDAACPFDWVHSGWSTQQRCPYSWSDVCQCTYQGRLLPPDLYMNFPLDFPGKYQHLPNIAAWLQEHRFFDQACCELLASIIRNYYRLLCLSLYIFVSCCVVFSPCFSFAFRPPICVASLWVFGVRRLATHDSR